MPRQFISAKRTARAIPPKPYVPKPQSTQQPTLSQQFTAQQKQEKSRFKWTPKPSNTETNQQRIFRRQQTALNTTDKPHFRVGGNQVYFPHHKIVLLRPSAKHTPYQAKFIVPTKGFNKLDLRDYLWNVYKLRALNVTTQLLWGKWTREQIGRPRHRLPQIKKMTIEMQHPFIWPEPVGEKQMLKKYNVEVDRELRKYHQDVERMGSDKLKPPTSFGGLIGPYVKAPEPFVPKRIARQMKNKVKKAEKKVEYEKNVDLVRNYLNM